MEQATTSSATTALQRVESIQKNIDCLRKDFKKLTFLKDKIDYIVALHGVRYLGEIVDEAVHEFTKDILKAIKKYFPFTNSQTCDITNEKVEQANETKYVGSLIINHNAKALEVFITVYITSKTIDVSINLNVNNYLDEIYDITSQFHLIEHEMNTINYKPTVEDEPVKVISRSQKMTFFDKLENSLLKWFSASNSQDITNSLNNDVNQLYKLWNAHKQEVNTYIEFYMLLQKVKQELTVSENIKVSIENRHADLFLYNLAINKYNTQIHYFQTNTLLKGVESYPITYSKKGIDLFLEQFDCVAVTKENNDIIISNKDKSIYLVLSDKDIYVNGINNGIVISYLVLYRYTDFLPDSLLPEKLDFNMEKLNQLKIE